jgi:Tfp pilus assembly protein PilX
MGANKQAQSGVTLVVALIMLAIVTLVVVSSVTMGMVNLRIVGNQQADDEARAAASMAIESFLNTASNFYPTPVGKPATGYDTNNDGKADYTVAIDAPVCRSVSPHNVIGAADPDYCVAGAKFGVYCWDTQWEVTATATNDASRVRQSVTQGVTIVYPPAFLPASAGC